MFKFSKISKKKILEFSGETIFNRGYDYYIDDMVEDFEFDPDTSNISATIYGSMGPYNIEVWNYNDYLKANCNCPFDGYPCKHIVAVLLHFLNNKDSYLKELDELKEKENLVEKKLSSLSKTELVGIISSFYKSNPSFKYELLQHLSMDNEKGKQQYFKDIDKIFRKFELDNFSTYVISHELKKIIKQVEPTDITFRIEIIWKITDSILHELNEYGMNDIPLESLGIETMNDLVHLFNKHPDLNEIRERVRAELEEYCNWHNCGIVDDICEAVYELSDENF